MTLQQLEYVIALDTYRHFVTAAEKTFVTQPTLTMQLMKLEEEIGLQIFDRTKKPLVPTRAGEQFILKSRQILREVGQLKEMISSNKETLVGEFRIGIIPTLAPYVLPLFLKSFLQENPQTHLKIYEMQSEDIIKSLIHDTLDLGLLVTPLNEKNLREVPLFYEPFLLYVPNHYNKEHQKSIHPSAIDTSKVLLLNQGHCFRNQSLEICNQSNTGAVLGFEYESGSIEALKALVKKGIGLTLVPELSVLDDFESDNVIRLDEPQPVREVSIVVHQSFSKEPLIDKIRSGILSNIPKSFVKNEKRIRVEWR